MRTCIYILMLAITVEGLRRVPDVIEESNEESNDDTSTDLEQDPSEGGVQKSSAMDTMDTSDDNVVEIKHWYGRLGNNLIQVANAIEIAEANGGKVVLPGRDKPGGFYEVFDSPSTIEVKQVDKKFPCHARDRRKSFPYWGMPRPRKGDTCFSQDERHRVMQTYLRPYLRETNATQEGDDKELVIHLRGGDLLDSHDSVSSFPQGSMPPCAAYDSVLHSFPGKFDKVRIITNDLSRDARKGKYSNPCVDEIIKSNPNKKVVVQSDSVIDDFMTMVNAKNLFLAYSTYSFTAYTMSNTVKNLFSMKGASFINNDGPMKKVAGTNLVLLSTPDQGNARNLGVDARVKWMVSCPEDVIKIENTEHKFPVLQ